MEKFFKLKENGTNVRTEIIAGITTFLTMSYIIFVNPSILSVAMGEDLWGSIFVATIIAAAIGTLVMGLVANVPFAQAPGMGLNAFFTYTVCLGMNVPWWDALGIVFICGIINILITVTRLRKSIIKAVPISLQNAIGGGIGLFIAYIGLKNAGILQFTVENVNTDAMLGTTYVAPAGSVIPELVNFQNPATIVAVIGLVATLVLMLLKVKGSILIGIVFSTIVALIMGVTKLPENLSIAIPDVSPTFWKANVTWLFDWSRLVQYLPVILVFSIADTFDTIGTFLGTGRRAGIFDEKDEAALEESKGFKSKLDKALFADATATSIGAIFGTSNTTTYVESAAGIAEGGRTGLTSVVVVILFLLCLPFSQVFGIVPAAATAPALIVVGILMASTIGKIDWEDFEEAVPAFFTLVMMPLAYNITTGVAFGFITYVIAKMSKGKAKEVHPIMYVVSVIFILEYVLKAVGIL